MITHLTASRVSQALLLLYPGSPHPSFPASGSQVVRCCSMLEFCRRGGKEPPLWNTQSNTTADHHWLHGGCSPFQPTLVSPPASLPPPPSRNSITCVVARNLLCVPRKSSSRLARDSGKQSAMDKAGSRGGWRSQAAGRKEGITHGNNRLWGLAGLCIHVLLPHYFSLLAWFFEENLDQPHQ